mmetsp:Transcript_37296/g.148842  ORF Transcript_37296/g.148842 Transcript_37296/m.148842 type:complete len:204 (+) Transcript_37296:332-943(+)
MTLEAVNNYWNGKAIRRARLKLDNEGLDMNEFGPFFEVDPKRPETHVFCSLTGQTLNRRRTELLHHLKGRRYKHFLRQHEAKKHKKVSEALDPDSDLESRSSDRSEALEANGDMDLDHDPAEKDEEESFWVPHTRDDPSLRERTETHAGVLLKTRRTIKPLLNGDMQSFYDKYLGKKRKPDQEKKKRKKEKAREPASKKALKN